MASGEVSGEGAGASRRRGGAAVRPLRICRVIARLNVGGVSVHIAQLTAGLDSQRFEQLVVTGREGKGEASMLPAVRDRGVHPLIVPELGRDIRPREDAIALAKLTYLFRRWRPDIVETHTAKAGTVGRLAAVLAVVPVRVHVFHGHVFEGFFGPRRTRAIVEVERRLAKLTTRIVALSEDQREELLGYGVGRPEQIDVVPLGLDLGPYLEAPRLAGRLRTELGLAGTPRETAPLVGIISRLVPTKAHEVFLAGAARILAAVPGAHFVIAGDGEPERRAALESMAAQPPLAGRVHFLGWRSSSSAGPDRRRRRAGPPASASRGSAPVRPGGAAPPAIRAPPAAPAPRRRRSRSAPRAPRPECAPPRRGRPRAPWSAPAG